MKDDNWELRSFAAGWSDLYNEYRAPQHESAVLKGIPNTLAMQFQVREYARAVCPRGKRVKIVWRGSSVGEYKRPQSYCHKEYATTLALYFYDTV